MNGYGFKNVRLFYIALFACWFLSCNPDKAKKIDKDQARFTTSDASELFFKNVRQTYYDREQLEAQKLDLYRFADRSTQADYPLFQLVIAVNWRYDQAYLLVEPNEVVPASDTLQIHWKSNINEEKGQYSYIPGNKASHFKFASQLYESLLDDHTLTLRIQGKPRELFLQRKDREAFRKTTFDYYRLVDLL